MRRNKVKMFLSNERKLYILFKLLIYSLLSPSAALFLHCPPPHQTWLTPPAGCTFFLTPTSCLVATTSGSCQVTREPDSRAAAAGRTGRRTEQRREKMQRRRADSECVVCGCCCFPLQNWRWAGPLSHTKNLNCDCYPSLQECT